MADFSITQIPAIMDANGWRVAATLLRRWFAGPANRTPESGIACWDVVKMDWVVGFERAKAAYRSIFEQGMWKTPNAQKEMRAVLKRLGKMVPNSCTNYGRDAVSLPRTHRDHVQFVSVGGGTWDMATSAIDHLTAALARFNFHVIALGTIDAADKPNRFTFTVSELGVYVRDSYDFNDAAGEDQDLGRWDPDDDSVGRTFMSGGTAVHNSDFRKWRDQNNRGGDYLIYSDVKYTTLKPPERFTLDG